MGEDAISGVDDYIEELRRVGDTLPVPTALVAVSSTEVLYGNAEFCELMGLTRVTDGSTRLDELVLDGAELSRLLAEAADHRVRDASIELHPSGGARRWVELSTAVGTELADSGAVTVTAIFALFGFAVAVRVAQSHSPFLYFQF